MILNTYLLKCYINIKDSPNLGLTRQALLFDNGCVELLCNL